MNTCIPRTLRNYKTPAGKIPFLEWLDSLKDPTTRLKIRHRLDRVERGNFGNFESVGDGVFELKLLFGPGYRIYFVEKNDLIIILHGGDKNTQTRDIKTAKKYWQELKERCYD